MRPLAPHFERIWYLVTAMAILASLPIEIFWSGYAAVATYIVWAGLILFAGVEYAASDTRLQGYYTGFFWYKISSDGFRWLCGLWLAAVVAWRLPHPFNWILGGGLAAWLPMHYAVRRFEDRLAQSIRKNRIAAAWIFAWGMLALLAWLADRLYL